MDILNGIWIDINTLKKVRKWKRSLNKILYFQTKNKRFMKRLLFFLFLCSNVLYAQKMPQTLQQVAQWQAVNTAKDSVFLWHFSFGEGSTETELALKMLENQRITRIQLVYTKYSSVKKFDQAALNQRRLEKMYALHPEWFDTQNGIVWEMVEQTGCNAKVFFMVLPFII
jgi:hypothetical protein